MAKFGTGKNFKNFVFIHFPGFHCSLNKCDIITDVGQNGIAQTVGNGVKPVVQETRIGEVIKMYTKEDFFREFPPTESPFVFPWEEEYHKREIETIKQKAEEEKQRVEQEKQNVEQEKRKAEELLK